jgi:outer membrane protein, heavy metal efflux system
VISAALTHVRRAYWSVFVTIRWLCLVPLCAIATAIPASADTLTIAQAADEAVQHNLTLIAQKANLTIAETQMLTARLRPNPVASFSADHLDVLGTGFDESNNGGPPEIAFRVDLPIERAGKREKRVDLAAASRAVAEAQFEDAVRTLRADVTLACIDVLAARATRDLVADNLRAFEELARVNRARADAGSIAPVESTRSQVAMLQFRSTAVRAQLDLSTALSRVRVLLGRSPAEQLDIAGDLRLLPSSTSPNLEAVQQVALSTRPDLRALQLSQAKSVADLRLQEALGRIDYTVGAEYRRQQGIAGKSNSLGVFISAPLPLLNRNQGEVARAGAERDQTSSQIVATRAQILADVEVAFHEYDVNRDLVAAIEHDLIQPATSAREISTYTYRAGGSSLVELLDAQRAFNDTMQSYLDAQAALRRAAARLNAATGAEVMR